MDNGISLDWRCLLVRAEAVLMVFVHCAGGLVGIKLIVMSKLNLFVGFLWGLGGGGRSWPKVKHLLFNLLFHQW